MHQAEHYFKYVLSFGSLGFVVYELDMFHEVPPHLCFSHNISSLFLHIASCTESNESALSMCETRLLRCVIYYPD